MDKGFVLWILAGLLGVTLIIPGLLVGHGAVSLLT